MRTLKDRRIMDRGQIQIFEKGRAEPTILERGAEKAFVLQK